MSRRSGARLPGAVWRAVLAGLLLACDSMPEDTLLLEPEETAEAAAAGLSVSPPFDVTAPRLRPQRLAESGPAIAFGGGRFLVVWRDTRVGGVFASRMDPDGTLKDPSGIALNPEPSLPSGDPSVAYDGTNFVVVWRNSSDGIFGTRVSPGGAVVGPRFTVSNSDEIGGGPPGLACAPTVCMVAFESIGDLATTITARRVLPDGTVLQNEASLSPDLPGIMSDTTVAWNGERFLVVWADARGGESTPDIYGNRVLPDGTVLDGARSGFPIARASGVQRHPSVVWTGTRFLVAWDDTRRGGAPDIFAARVRDSGEVSEPGGIRISTASGAQRFPRVAPQGGKSLIVWEDLRSGHRRAWGARITEAGELVDTSGIPISEGEEPEERLPFVAGGGDRYLVAWAGAVDATDEGPMYIRGKRVSRPGEVLDDTSKLFTRAANRQEVPAVAANADGYLVAWRETRSPDGPTVYAARMRPDGSVLDVNGIRLPSGMDPQYIQVASDGRDFLVVWAEREPGGYDKNIRGARVSRSGAVLDATGISLVTVTGDQERPAVDFFGGVYLVVWEDDRGRETGMDAFSIYGARVSTSGVVLEPDGRRFSSGLAFTSSPGVTHAGSNFLVTWSEDGTPIRGARMTPGGAMLDPGGFPLLTTGPVASVPSLSTDGTVVLVVWEQWQGPNTNLSDVYGMRVTSGGTAPGTPFLIASGPLSEGNPRATFDGNVHLVVWERDDEPLSFRSVSDVFATRVTQAGAVLDVAGIPLATTPDVAERGPVVASVGGARSVVLFERWVPAPEVNETRVRARLLDSD
ncbi:hypothetical protein NR800_08865 [Corallococcus interemptor]|uniref:hypothetical protein n=1 Tax=Corallococcus interemptor TaxID=2316720 RepID=UPI0035D4EB8D